MPTFPLVCLVVYVTGLYPLWRAWVALRETSLAHAYNWLLLAWAGWGGLLSAAVAWPADTHPLLAYTSLALTGCAAVAVLGARRPGVGAWNFVLLGLLAVYFLPVAEGWGRLRLGWPYAAFLAGTLAVGVLNYLPTRLWLPALMLGAGCAAEFAALVGAGGPVGEGDEVRRWAGRWLVALTPWAAYVQVRLRQVPGAEFDRRWLEFRDRYGFVWGQRTREQFNRSAANRGWPVRLYWQGLRLRSGSALPGPETQAEIVETLQALLKRFEAETDQAGTGPPA